MGLFYQHYINETTRLGVWRIEEPEEFFLQKVLLHNEVSHPYKRLQHLAGRYLLPTLFNDFPLKEILIADTRKPFLVDELYHFSVAHCGNFAAAIVSKKNRVGVDIEFVTPRIQRISSKFLNDTEHIFLEEWQHLTQLYLQLVTVVWSSKEAIFKWYGNGEVNFKNHIELSGEVVFHADEWIELPFVFRKSEGVAVTVFARLFQGLVLAWVIT